MLKHFDKEEKYILYGMFGIFILGVLIHFIYTWSGTSAIIGSISPVNESIWEHGKLSLIPILLWYTIYYFFNKNINKNGWFFAMLIALITSILTIPLLYYFYTGAFGIESLVIDIIIFFISLFLGQIIGLYTYRHWLNFPNCASIIIYLLIIFLFIFFTFYPLKLPIFRDPSTNSYGIHSLK